MTANSTKAGLVATCKGLDRDGTFHYGTKGSEGREAGEGAISGNEWGRRTRREKPAD